MLVKREKLVKYLEQINIYTPIIVKALEVARQVHFFHKRDAGGSYLEEHIYPLAYTVAKEYKESEIREDLTILALLHDTLEDGDLTKEDLKVFFPKHIVDNVLAITKSAYENEHGLPQEERYIRNGEYLNRIIQSNEQVRIVKIEDRIQNLNSTPKQAILDNPKKHRRYSCEARERFLPIIQTLKTELQERYIERLNQAIARIERILDNIK